jgi:hypothetical protein
LGQTLPAFAATPLDDLAATFCARAGKKAVFVATFSFGGLVCSLHGF